MAQCAALLNNSKGASAVSLCAWCQCRRGFERLIRKVLGMPSGPAMLICHWWAPLHFKSSFWNVAEDELDTIGSYYDLQV